MPSFDIVSELNLQEADNAVNQAKKEIESRFDFRGLNAEIQWDKKIITIIAPDDKKLDAIKDILQSKFHRRGIDIRSLKFKKAETMGGQKLKVVVELQQGIPAEIAKEISKAIRDSKLKVQSQIMDDRLRVNSKSIDSLQEAISYIKQKDFDLPLQFINMRS